MNPETSFLDDDIRPAVIDQFLLCYELAGTLDEIDQNIERPPAKRKRDLVAPKHSLADRKLERAKTQISVKTVSHGSQYRFSVCAMSTQGERSRIFAT